MTVGFTPDRSARTNFNKKARKGFQTANVVTESMTDEQRLQYEYLRRRLEIMDESAFGDERRSMTEWAYDV